MTAAAHRAPKAVTPRKAVAVAVVGLTAGTVAMVPGSSQALTLDQAKTQYHDDLSKAEAAGQAYDEQQQAYAQLQQKISALQAEISTQNRQIAELDDVIGAQAAAQYRNGGMSQGLQLALASSPDSYLAKQASQSEIAAQEAKQLKTVTQDQAALRQEQSLAATLVAQQQQALAGAKAAKDTAENLEHQAKQLLESLTPAQQAQVDVGTGGKWTHYTGKLPVATGRAAIAIAYAESKLGDPYVWGANGPNAFDCSGFVQQAWLAAGVSIPRTSYEEWAQLPHVSVDQLQPGDLLFFEPDSQGPGHVALYVGDGMYVQETHPGSIAEWASLDPSSPYYGNMPYVGAARVG
jgi:cell wall-associated NlpC family hydrolase